MALHRTLEPQRHEREVVVLYGSATKMNGTLRFYAGHYDRDSGRVFVV